MADGGWSAIRTGWVGCGAAKKVPDFADSASSSGRLKASAHMRRCMSKVSTGMVWRAVAAS